MRIAEVADKYDMPVDTIRYYERIGLIPHVERTSGGIRDFRETDCNWVEFIKCMRNAGVQIEALVEYVALFQEGEGTEEARKEILIEQRDLLLARARELEATIGRLNDKIEYMYGGEGDGGRHCDDKLRA